MKRSLIAALLISGIAIAAPLSIRDGLGRAVTVNAPVKRIVALSLTVTEILADINLPPIGRPSSATFPEAFTKNIAEVGSAYRPDLEKVVALKPDLLLGSVAENVVRRAPCSVLTVRSVEPSKSTIATG